MQWHADRAALQPGPDPLEFFHDHGQAPSPPRPALALSYVGLRANDENLHSQLRLTPHLVAQFLMAFLSPPQFAVFNNTAEPRLGRFGHKRGRNALDCIRPALRCGHGTSRSCASPAWTSSPLGRVGGSPWLLPPSPRQLRSARGRYDRDFSAVRRAGRPPPRLIASDHDAAYRQRQAHPPPPLRHLTLSLPYLISTLPYLR